jgi:hypothetical protein
MRRTSVLLILGPACGLLLGSSAPARATYPLPEPSTGAPPVVQRVEVPAPVDDSTAEFVQMQVAAAVGALVGGMVTAVRMRRRAAAALPAGTGLIDLGASGRHAA